MKNPFTTNIRVNHMQWYNDGIVYQEPIYRRDFYFYNTRYWWCFL